jgi:DHA1 family tetracycline resistance protein-like MFS transporter
LVQGLLIRWVLPITGLRVAGIIGLVFMIMAYIGYAAATAPWMLYVAMVPGALGGLAGASMQGIASNRTGASQQGELQGGIESAMSLTAIVSPIMMTQTFGYFTSSTAPVYFAGAAFVLAGLLAACSLLLFVKVTSGSQAADLMR